MNTKTKNNVKKLTAAGMLLAMALVLPILTGQIPEIGAMLCPMHIPVLLCGFICGWQWGGAVGLIAPILRSVLFGNRPPMYPTAVAMAFELAVYGIICGMMYRAMPKKIVYYYLDLITAMVAGRLVWGAVQFILAGIGDTEFSVKIFFAGAITNAIPGIILQLILIPAVV